MRSFTFIDLFAGIGGTRLGFEAAGGECVFSSEWDKFSQQTYAANHGEAPAGNIHEVSIGDIPRYEVLVAGFPCQPFSLAGVSKLNSLGRKNGFENPEQGNLFFKIAEILDVHQPRAFLLENVKNLKGHDQGRTFEVITSTLRRLGYEPRSAVIDAAAVVPQHRERIYIAGFRDQADDERFQFPQLKNRNRRLTDILESPVAEKYTLSDKLWSYLQGHAEKHRAAGNGFGFGLPDLDGVSRTLSARYYKDGSEILIRGEGVNPRRLTPRECARLMGFPDEFKIPVSDTQAYRQFGNSVVVPVIERIARSMVQAMDLPLPKQGGLDHWKPTQQPRLPLSLVRTLVASDAAS